MAKSKQQKQKLVDSYVEWLNESPALFVVSPTSITPNEATELRKKLRASKATFNVVKNTLFAKALKDIDRTIEGLEIEGENAVVFCRGEASEAAKIVYDFIKEIKKGELKGGLLDGATVSAAQIEELATLPSREVLLAITVAAFQAPVSGFVNVLNANILNLVNVIKNISDNKSD